MLKCQTEITDMLVFSTLWTPFVVSARTQSLGQGNVFRSVCHSAHSGEGGLPLGGLHPGDLPTEGLLTGGSAYTGSAYRKGSAYRRGPAYWGVLHSDVGSTSRGIGQTPWVCLGRWGGGGPWASESENWEVRILREWFLVCLYFLLDFFYSLPYLFECDRIGWNDIYLYLFY